MMKVKSEVKVSIVMPLYNAEKYLAETLDSVYHQTFSEFEILFVNDCSEDHTQQILDAYQTKDIRAKCITLHQKHGAGMARNIGMDHAEGKYIIFLDADDIFHQDMLKNAYEKIIEYDTDLVCFNYSAVQSEDIHKKITHKYSQRFVEKYCRRSFHITDMNLSDFNQINTAAWNKLYRLQYLKDNGLRFQNLPCCNDVFFVLMSFFLASKMIMLDTDDTMLYFRVHLEKSRIANNQNPMCGFYAFDEIQKELTRKGLFDQYYQYFYTSSFFNLHSLCIATKDNRQRQEFDIFIKETAIDKWCIKKSEFYHLLAPFIRTQWENWREHGAEQMSKDIGIRFVIEDFSKQIIGQFSRWKTDNKQIAIWGIGRKGRCLLGFLYENDMLVDMLIDANEKKQGEVINGLIISPPSTDNIDIIVVTAVEIVDQVEQYVKKCANKNIEIVQLESIWEGNILNA